MLPGDHLRALPALDLRLGGARHPAADAAARVLWDAAPQLARGVGAGGGGDVPAGAADAVRADEGLPAQALSGCAVLRCAAPWCLLGAVSDRKAAAGAHSYDASQKLGHTNSPRHTSCRKRGPFCAVREELLKGVSLVCLLVIRTNIHGVLGRICFDNLYLNKPLFRGTQRRRS